MVPGLVDGLYLESSKDCLSKGLKYHRVPGVADGVCVESSKDCLVHEGI